MYVTPRKAVDYLLAGKVHDVVGITGIPRILILDGLTPFGASVECRVSLSSGELVCSARFVWVGCFMVDNTIFYI